MCIRDRSDVEVMGNQKAGGQLTLNQKDIKIGTFGSTTAQAVRDAGLRLDLEAPTVQAPVSYTHLGICVYIIGGI